MDSYETYELWWRGQKLILRWCADSFVYAGVGHMELLTEDRSPHPISQTGYRSHFIPRYEVENMGGPEAYAKAWLETKDDGKPVQLSLF
ncbi:MAG: hypothetical protein CSB48_02465 [Proteobacteria bacterium]|nr:MAG: hypothetical protein CSB48_02465 [Pseudomonadota bacterium]